MRNLLWFSIFMVFVTSCENSPAPIDPQRLGQMVLIGFRGTEPGEHDAVIRDLSELNVGGVILYDEDHQLNTNNRNITSQDQLLKLTGTLISRAATPPIIAVHQDGGPQSPLHSLYDVSGLVNKGFLSDSAKAQQYSQKFAREFMVLGLNTNFNPRLDLSTQSTQGQNDLIGSNAESVAQQASIILDEYDMERMFSVPKYFPGYSSTYQPKDTTDDITSDWSEDFLKPYRMLFSEREINGIMTAHSFNAQIDSVWPGTLSYNTVTGLLRDSLGFEGVVISDDLQKPILSSKYDRETIIAQTLNAGVDILLFGNNYEYDEDLAPKVIQIIQKLIAEGKVPRSRVEEALKRIDRLKQDVIAELCTCMNF